MTFTQETGVGILFETKCHLSFPKPNQAGFVPEPQKCKECMINHCLMNETSEEKRHEKISK